MKNKLNLLVMLAMVLALSVAVIGCKTDADDDSGGGGAQFPTELQGTWSGPSEDHGAAILKITGGNYEITYTDFNQTNKGKCNSITGSGPWTAGVSDEDSVNGTSKLTLAGNVLTVEDEPHNVQSPLGAGVYTKQ